MATHTIAVVEDNTSLQLLYKTKFELEGYRVVTAENGQRGLQVIKDSRPDLILLDLRMPVMNGDEMLEKLRAEDWGANIRVIVLTNISRDEAPKGLSLLGVERYVVKAHHTPSQVVAMVREVLGTNTPT